MRHGLTEWNSRKRIQGRTEIPLCDEGRDMAGKWAQSLSADLFDLILTSTLGRAVQTAEIINSRLNLPVHADPRLAEQDWGKWTGLTKAELKEQYALVKAQEKRGFAFTPPGGESRDSVLMRACDALMDFSHAHSGARVLVVTHQGVLKCLAYALSGLDYMPGDPLPIEPYRLHRIECLDNELAPAQWNIGFDDLAATLQAVADMNDLDPEAENREP
jgi:probable phosphoglycerate mutase